MTTAADTRHASPGGGRLQPVMHVFGALLITLSSLSPTLGVFVIGSEVVHGAGSGALIAYAVATVLGLCMALVYGELASAFPSAGGEYTILSRILGPGVGVAVLGGNLLGFALCQALAGQGVASYLAPLLPGAPAPVLAGIVVLVATALAILNIRVNAVVTGAFLALELLALAAVAMFAALHPERSLTAVLRHPVIVRSDGALVAPSLAVLGASVSGAIYALNGYGSAVFLGEEVHEARSSIARVVLLALLIAAVVEILPIAAILTGAPDLKALISAQNPVESFVRARAGPVAAGVLSAAIALAIFNTMIAVALMAGRQLYAGARDGLWPRPVSRFLAKISPRFGSPLPATAAVGAAGLLGCLSSRSLLVLILGNGCVVLYAFLCLAAIVGRVTGSTRGASSRMPLFPAAPALGAALLAGVVWFDLQTPEGREGLLATALVTIAGALYWALVLRRRTARLYVPPAPAAAADLKAGGTV